MSHVSSYSETNKNSIIRTTMKQVRLASLLDPLNIFELLTTEHNVSVVWDADADASLFQCPYPKT